jgi:hypothetical protein
MDYSYVEKSELVPLEMPFKCPVISPTSIFYPTEYASVCQQGVQLTEQIDHGIIFSLIAYLHDAFTPSG